MYLDKFPIWRLNKSCALKSACTSTEIGVDNQAEWFSSELVLLDGSTVEASWSPYVPCTTLLCSCLCSYQPPCVTLPQHEFYSSLELEVVEKVCSSLTVRVSLGSGPSLGETEIPISRKERKMKWYSRSFQWKNMRIKALIYVNWHLGSGIYFVYSCVCEFLNLICPMAHYSLEFLTKHYKVRVILKKIFTEESTSILF